MGMEWDIMGYNGTDTIWYFNIAMEKHNFLQVNHL